MSGPVSMAWWGPEAGTAVHTQWPTGSDGTSRPGAVEGVVRPVLGLHGLSGGVHGVVRSWGGHGSASHTATTGS
jgi:hypothetical protein